MKLDLDRAGSPLARRPTDEFLERPAECGFGFVADFMGDSGNLNAGFRKPLGGDLHTPLGQILDRRTAHDLGKAIGPRRTSRSSFRSELFQRPDVGGPRAQQRQRAADQRIP